MKRSQVWEGKAMECAASETRTSVERELLLRMQAALQLGCLPYTNQRRICVPRRFSGLPLIDFLCRWQPAILRKDWLLWLELGQIVDERQQPAVPGRLVREGEQFHQQVPNTVEPAINPDLRLVYEDEHLMALNKPAPLPCHPSGRFHRNSLIAILERAYPQEQFYLVHRLDCWTTGVTLLARTKDAARLLQKQFAEKSIEKSYVARVYGHPSWREFRCELPIDVAEKARAGRRHINWNEGVTCRTDFRVIELFNDGTSLIEARPHTGRTNQIRIHLHSLGYGIVGDRVYGEPADEGACEGPLMLHARAIQLRHPVLGNALKIEARVPAWRSL